MWKGLTRWSQYWAPAFLLVFAAFLKIQEPRWALDFQDRVFDQFQRFKPRLYEDVGVRVVDIDDESLARLGQWPWPRTQVARLVDRLRSQGAKSIAFDALFAEPDRTSPSRIPELSALGVDLSRLPDHDEVLSRAFARAPVVAGFTLTGEENGRRPAVKARLNLMGANPLDLVGPRNAFAGAIPSLPILERAAAGNGNFSFRPEDSTIRRVPLLFKLGDQLLPSLALEALRVAGRASSLDVKSTGASGTLDFGESGIAMLRAGGRQIPTNAQGEVWLYDTGFAAARTVPAWRVLEPGFDPAPIRGSVIFVGTSAPGLLDLRATPLSPAAPGVWVHAEVAEQALGGTFLRRPYWAAQLELFYLILLGVLLIVLLPRAGAAWCSAVGGAAIAIACWGSWRAFSEHLFLLDPVMPSLMVLSVYLCSSAITYVRSDAEKKRIRGAFSRYMSPVFVAELAKHPEKLKLGGEMKDMTLLFMDIRGFTTISEQFASNPHGLTQLINRFLTPMTGIILDHQGTIDKYMGDCIMAFWNAPLDDADHARNACSAALEMCARLKALNLHWEAQVKTEGGTFVPIRVGVGINTGTCCVGNMGSEQRFDYSVLGDDVNLASRLEGQSKTYGVDIVVGENTERALRDFTRLELDLIRVKGKTKPVRIFALLGDRGLLASDTFAQLAESHDAMLKSYRSQKWTDASRHIASCRKLAAGLRGVRLGDLYALYAERVRTYRAHPPGKRWDGVFVATSK